MSPQTKKVAFTPPNYPKMSHRAKAMARIANPTLPRRVHREGNLVTDSFLQSKLDKKLIRKSAFRAKVVERRSEMLASSLRVGGGGGGGGSSGRLSTLARGGRIAKRRRPSKKLVTNLQSLVDALPVLDHEAAAADKADNSNGNAKQHQQSLQIRPGALKRKEMLVQAERANFQTNLAQLVAVSPVAADPATEVQEIDAATAVATADSASRAPTASRYALLRDFISATMEQNPAFANGTAK